MENSDSGSQFCHIVIPAPNLDSAKSFYENVFGWQVQANVPGPKYWFYKSGNVGGAFDGNRQPASHSVVLILRVEDMNATIELIKKHGGSITQARSAIGEAAPGYDAYFLDPNGNAMGIASDK